MTDTTPRIEIFCGLPLLDAVIEMIWGESELRDISADLDVCREVAEALSA